MDCCTPKMDIRHLPFPFSLLDVRKAKSSSGKCWLFHMSKNGIFSGFLFSGGYRLFNVKDVDFDHGEFFIECRNFKHHKFGLVSALIPQEPKLGENSCQLTLVNCVVFDRAKNEFMVNYHIFKKGGKYCKFRKERFDQKTIETYFELGIQKSIGQLNVIYLNSLQNNSLSERQYTELVPVQSSIHSPDVWDVSSFKVDNTIELKSVKKVGFGYISQNRKKRKNGDVKRLENHVGDTMVFIKEVKQTYFNEKTKNTFFHLIPYGFKENEVVFGKITGDQYDFLLDEYDKRGPYSTKCYRERILSFTERNGEKPLTCFVMNHLDHQSGTMVCLCSDICKIPNNVTTMSNNLEGVFIYKTKQNPSDYDLPSGLVPVFRGYPWPFQNSMTENEHEVLNQTYTKKGLKRHCTNHYGNFEMIGKRSSSQCTGSMIAIPKEVHKHQYYRKTMNLLLLPLVRGLINSLQEEAIVASNTSGETLMKLYRKILGLTNEKDICEQTIITQKNSITQFTQTRRII